MIPVVGAPLPLNAWVFRFFKSSDGTPTAVNFELVDRDRSADGINAILSVWQSALIAVQDARALCPPKPHVVHLECAAVRAIDAEMSGTLDVVESPAIVLASDGTDVIDQRPGAKAHAGILGLNRGTKRQNRALREALARYASRCQCDSLAPSSS